MCNTHNCYTLICIEMGNTHTHVALHGPCMAPSRLMEPAGRPNPNPNPNRLMEPASREVQHLPCLDHHLRDERDKRNKVEARVS